MKRKTAGNAGLAKLAVQSYADIPFYRACGESKFCSPHQSHRVSNQDGINSSSLGLVSIILILLYRKC
jgi:hypothetical protein